jgi:hypothetical protein
MAVVVRLRFTKAFLLERDLPSTRVKLVKRITAAG